MRGPPSAVGVSEVNLSRFPTVRKRSRSGCWQSLPRATAGRSGRSREAESSLSAARRWSLRPWQGHSCVRLCVEPVWPTLGQFPKDDSTSPTHFVRPAAY